MRRLLIFNSGVFVYGAEKCLLNLVSVLQGNYEITVILPKNGPLCELLRQRHCKVIIYPLAILSAADSPFWGLHYLLLFLVNIPSFIIYAVLLRYDCFISNTLLLIPPLFASKICGRKFIWFIREFFPLRAVNRLAAFLARNLSDRVVCMSRNISVEVFGASSGMAPRIRVIHEPLPIILPDKEKIDPLRRELNITQGSIVVSLIARVHPLKGQLEFLRAYAEILKRYNVTVLLAGDLSSQTLRSRAYAHSLRQFIQEGGLSGNVRLLGYRQDAAELLGLSDICVFPYLRNEPFGLSIQEAICAGKPVFYYSNPGLEEAIGCFRDKEAFHLSAESLEQGFLRVLSREPIAAQDRSGIAFLSESTYREEVNGLLRGVFSFE